MSKILDLVLAGTTAQFDNDASLATTQFVQRALGNVAGQSTYVTNTTIPPSDAGRRILANAANITLTLPLLSSVPVGSRIIIKSAVGTITVQRQGTDPILAGIASPTSISVAYGEVVEFIAGDVNWNLEGGDVLNKVSEQFASQLTGNGYQKLPSGLIVKWGTTAASASADVTVTFPTAFPNAALICLVTPGVSGSGVFANYHTLTASSFELAAWSANATRVAASVSWLAIGV